jgi:hypothetical protein
MKVRRQTHLTVKEAETSLVLCFGVVNGTFGAKKNFYVLDGAAGRVTERVHLVRTYHEPSVIENEQGDLLNIVSPIIRTVR